MLIHDLCFQNVSTIPMDRIVIHYVTVMHVITSVEAVKHEFAIARGKEHIVTRLQVN